MPGFPFLFEEKVPGDVRQGDRVVTIPGPRAPKGVVVVAKPEAIALADYLISLNRTYPVEANPEAPPGVTQHSSAGHLAEGRQ